MTISPITPNIGAEISDIDISGNLSDEQEKKIYKVFCQYGVIFFRDQHLSPQQQIKIARIFGEPEPSSHPKFSSFEDAPEVSVIINDEDTPPDINVWHTDLTYQAKPAKACVLYCLETPAIGGDTIWSNMRAVYKSLSPQLQDLVANLSARHQLSLENVTKEQIKSVIDKEIDAIHPLVHVHPDTKDRSLFVNSVYTKKIIELPAIESRNLLQMLFNICEQPEFQIRFNWRKHSVAIWDNRCTQHYAVADYYPARRIMHRVSILGNELIPC
jgi:taurine dioxygenase